MPDSNSGSFGGVGGRISVARGEGPIDQGQLLDGFQIALAGAASDLDLVGSRLLIDRGCCFPGYELAAEIQKGQRAVGGAVVGEADLIGL